jgi:D-sedoheptulose 7-phosphate isomerase
MRAPSAAAALIDAVADSREMLEQVERWGTEIADALLAGGRLLVAGNGGSAAEAQHLTAELVGRFEAERRPLSAIALHAETSSLTAITNDYGAEQAFARQVRAHGRPGDVLLVLSTSGESANVVAAVRAAHELGLTPLALTGPGPHALCALCDRCACVPCDRTATIQEIHLLCVHVLCSAVDQRVGEQPYAVPAGTPNGTRDRATVERAAMLVREPSR